MTAYREIAEKIRQADAVLIGGEYYIYLVL